MKAILIFISLLIGSQLMAQKGVLTFDREQIDLGTIKSDDVPVQIVYTFKNTGNAPIILSQVTPRASKVTADWEKSPIMPQASAKITLTFIPVEHRERFNYTINVRSNAQNGDIQLRLIGKQIDNPEKPYLLYKHNMDSVYFKSPRIAFGNVYTDQVKSDTLYFYNMRKGDLRLSTHPKPKHLTTTFIPEVVKAGEKGMIIVTLNAKEKNDFGYIYENIILKFNDDNSYRNRIELNVNLKEDFSKLSEEELKNAPVAHFETTSIDFGEIKVGEKADCDFILENKGKSNLIIRKTKASCGCTAVTLGEKTLQPGASTTIRASFNSSGRKGRQHKSITVITNDPQKPEIALTFSGKVLE